MKVTLKGVIGAAVVASMVLANPAGASALNDAAILSIFDQANMADITTARLGLKKGHSPEVRELARMVLTDHEAVQQMGRAVGKTEGIIALPPDNDTALTAHAKAYDELQAKSGIDFDRAYLKHEIAFHQSVVDAIKGTLLPSIANAGLKSLVVKVLPGFEHHLAETRRVAEKLGIE